MMAKMMMAKTDQSTYELGENLVMRMMDVVHAARKYRDARGNEIKESVAWRSLAKALGAYDDFLVDGLDAHARRREE